MRIFRLNVIELDGDYEDDELNLEYNSDMYVPSHEVNIGTYSSIENAEHTIADYLKHNNELREIECDSIVLGFEIIETELDEGYIHITDFDCDLISSFKSRRSYLPDGSLNCISDYDDECTIKFYGRDVPVNFKRGDIVMMDRATMVEPVIIAATPYTKDEWKKTMNPGVAGDCTDDSYTAITLNDGHCHPCSMHVYPYVGKIPENVRVKLEKNLQLYEDGRMF